MKNLLSAVSGMVIALAAFHCKDEKFVKWCNDAGGEKCACVESTRKNTEGGTLEECTLAKDSDVQGFPAKGKETISFHATGRLQHFTPSKDVEVHGYTAVKDFPVGFHKNGKLDYLVTAKDVSIGGHTIKKNEGFNLHPSGKLNKFVLVAPTKIQNITFPEGVTIFLGEDGKLSSCLLGSDGFTLEGKKYEARAVLYFDGDGRVTDVR